VGENDDFIFSKLIAVCFLCHNGISFLCLDIKKAVNPFD
jgi:hypothetical protein